MKKYLGGLLVLIFVLTLHVPTVSAATIFSDDFGANGLGTDGDDISWGTWDNGGNNSGDDAELRVSSSGNDSASPNGGRHAVIFGEEGYICVTINTTGYQNVKLSYNWRGDNDAEGSDDGLVEYKATGSSCTSGAFTNLKTHDLSVDSSWSTQSAFDLPDTLDNTTFKLRFRVDSSSDDEHFRVDGISITGDSIVTTGSLQVIKNTLGGEGTFSFTGAGSFNITTVSGTGSNTRTNLTPGSYTITESVPSGWVETSNTCASVAVTAGNTATCTITNTKKGSITVYKNVVNPEGGEVSDAQSFSIMLNGANTQSISENSSYAYTNLTPGAYTIAESANGAYDFVAFSLDEDAGTDGAQITLAPGANIALTITNKQKVGSITVNKVVTNPNGGTAVAGDFSFSVNGGSPIQFIQNELNSLLGSNVFTWNPGAVSITESIGQYAISYSGCNFVLASNGNNTCTITNSDIPAGQGAITVVKNVINDDGGTKTVGDFNLYIGEMPVTSGQANFLEPGEYTVSEGTLPSGYTQTSLVCSNGESTTSGTVNLTEQSAWTCTITNDDQPAHLTIAKNTVNDALNGALDGEFSFNISSQEAPITLTTSEGMASTTLELNAGSYTLSENVPADWMLSSISCESEGDEVEDGVSLNLANGQEVTCTFVNTRKMGSVKITKVIEQGDGTKTASDFMIYMSLSNEEVPESPKAGSEEGVVYGPFVLGTYKIFENNQIANGVGYAPHYDGDCDPTGMITLVAGETLECKVTNTRFVHSGGGSGGGQVLGEQTENTESTNTNPTPATEPKTEAPKGEVLGEQTESTTASCSAYLAKYMYFKRANDKEEVKKLQTFLNEHMGLTLKVDGVYGAATRDAVKAFQEKYKEETLVPWEKFGLKDGKGTGNVYKTTLRWINMVKCPSLALPMPELP